MLAQLTTEQIARGVLEKFTDFLRQAQANHPECSADKPTSSQGVCPALLRAIGVQTHIVGAIHVYCSGAPLAGDKPYVDKGPCSPVPAAEPSLQGVLATALSVMAQQAALAAKGGN